MFRLLLGLIKGAVLGGAVGYGAYALGLGGGFNWVTYGAVGVVVGLFVGRPLWSHLRDKNSTVWVSILKALFGCGIGVGLYALAQRFLDLSLLTFSVGGTTLHSQYVLAAAIGGIFGAWIELDDAPAKKRNKAAAEPPAE